MLPDEFELKDAMGERLSGLDYLGALQTPTLSTLGSSAFAVLQMAALFHLMDENEQASHLGGKHRLFREDVP